jgi:hypothetical protein
MVHIRGRLSPNHHAKRTHIPHTGAANSLMIPLPLLILGLLAPQENLAPKAYAILADRCFPCHGPDANTRKAGL